MARHASTYRQARRAAWQAKQLVGWDGDTPLSWEHYNRYAKGEAAPGDDKRFGPIGAKRSFAPAGRSKYMPHIGNKQRAKGAAA